MRFTSDDGQLGADGDLALAVLCYTFIDIFVTWGSQRLDSENSTGSLVKLNGL